MSHAATVLTAYHHTMSHNAGLIPLVWALGASLKLDIGYYPHLVLQGPSGSGKSTLLHGLRATIPFNVFGRDCLDTERDRAITLSQSDDPVAWKGLGDLPGDETDRAIELLYDAYRYVVYLRGIRLKKYFIRSPALLSEDGPVHPLIAEKVVCVRIREKYQPLPNDLPLFPFHEWKRFIAGLDRGYVKAMNDGTSDYLQSQVPYVLPIIAQNYSVVLTAWWLLKDFSGLDDKDLDCANSLMAEMEYHIDPEGGE